MSSPLVGFLQNLLQGFEAPRLGGRFRRFRRSSAHAAEGRLEERPGAVDRILEAQPTFVAVLRIEVESLLDLLPGKRESAERCQRKRMLEPPEARGRLASDGATKLALAHPIALVSVGERVMRPCAERRAPHRVERGAEA